MRRLATITLCTALLALATGVGIAQASELTRPAYPLTSPEDPVRALFLYHLVGPEYGRRTVWHPQANLFEAFMVDSALEMAGQNLRDTYQPTEEQLAEIAALAEDQLFIEVIRSQDRPDRAIVRALFAPDGSDDNPTVFAVALHGDEWRILALVGQDNPDPWTVFAALDTPTAVQESEAP